jgi:hypothetical protein
VVSEAFARLGYIQVVSEKGGKSGVAHSPFNLPVEYCFDWGEDVLSSVPLDVCT